MEFVFIWIGFAVVTAIAANARGHNAALWGIIGLLGGVFALIAVLVIKPASPSQEAAGLEQPQSALDDSLIEMHRGVAIRRSGSFVVARGISYPDAAAARRAIDQMA